MDKNNDYTTGVLAPCLWVLIVLAILFVPWLGLPIVGTSAALLVAVWLAKVMTRDANDDGCSYIGDNSPSNPSFGDLAAGHAPERPGARTKREAEKGDAHSPVSSKSNVGLPSRRRSSSKWLPVAMAGIAAATVCVLSVMLATRASNSAAPIDLRPRTNPDLPREYITVAKFLSHSISSKPKTVKSHVDMAQGMAEAQEAILNLDGIEYADPQLEAVAGQAVASLQSLVELASELQALPEPPDALSESVLGLVLGFTGDVGGFLMHLNDLAEQDQRSQDVCRRILVELTKLKSHELLLPAIARKYAGPPLSDPRIVAIDLDEALFPELPDRLALLNGSQHVLHHCTLVVTLAGPSGETKKHVHFIEEWPPDQAAYALYSGGKTSADLLIRDSLASIDSVSVSLYCDELSCEDVAYHYAGQEKDRDVGAFLKPLRLALQYRPFAAGLIFHDEPAAICSFSGLTALPRGKLAVTFYHGQQSRTQILDFESWQAGAQQTIEFPELEWRPDQWNAALQLNGAAFHPVLEAPVAVVPPATKK